MRASHRLRHGRERETESVIAYDITCPRRRRAPSDVPRPIGRRTSDGGAVRSVREAREHMENGEGRSAWR